MYIKCWGSRGSIPVSGRSYNKYGGDTTCLEVRSRNNDILIIDAGTGVRRLGDQLLKEGESTFNFIFTHAHWDHLMGFPFFKPLYRKKSRIHMLQCPFPQKYIGKMLSSVMTPPNFPVRFADLQAEILYDKACPLTFKIGSLTIDPIELNHPNNGRGYKLSENGKTFIFLTDNELDYVHPEGLTKDAYAEICTGADLLIHDAMYTPAEYRHTRGHGHSVYTDTAELACRAGVKQLGLFHLNPDRTDREMDAVVADCRKLITRRGGNATCFAVGSDMVFHL